MVFEWHGWNKFVLQRIIVAVRSRCSDGPTRKPISTYTRYILGGQRQTTIASHIVFGWVEWMSLR
jgi:hypothetical protein